MSGIELKEFLQAETIFRGLTDSELDEVLEIMNIREFKRNETVFLDGEEGDSFYLVLSGEVRIYKISADGREKTLATITSGDFFGEMALLDHKVRSASAATVTKSKLGTIYREHFNKLIYEHPQIPLKMIVQLTERLRRANDQIESLAFKDVRERVVQFILQSVEIGETGSGLMRKTTHQEIANLIGSSRETVTRILGQLQENGLISLDGRSIVVLKREELAQLLS